MRVTENGAEVQQDQAQEQNSYNNFSTHEANVDSAVNLDDVTTSGFKDGSLISAKELKPLISFQALLEADRHKLQISGNYVKCCCPFHPDSNPSFVIYDDVYGKCYGCSWYGDVYKYEMEFHRVDFRSAWLRLNDFYYDCPRAGRKAKATLKKVKLDEPQFTPRQLSERKNYAQRLANEAWLAEKVCFQRYEVTGENWNPAVIQDLAKNGFLGWADCLAFIYPRGTKYRRWPEKEFHWDCDGSSLWRGELLAEAKHVYLTESETDAIALLHTGIEEDEEGAAIIAVSGAGNFQSAWAEQFKGKVVTLCFDNDEAGKDGANKTGLLLKPYASEILILPLGGAI
jgi:hypothetical protein